MEEKKNPRRNFSPDIVIPAMIFLLFGIFMIVFPILFDRSLVAIILLSSLCIIASVGIFLVKRWGFWLALALSPFMIVTTWTAFTFSKSLVGFAPNIQTETFHIMLIIWATLAVVSVLFLLSKRKAFK